MKCEVCGCEIPNGANVCSECGFLQESRFQKQFNKKSSMRTRQSQIRSDIPHGSYTQTINKSMENRNPYPQNNISNMQNCNAFPQSDYIKVQNNNPYLQNNFSNMQSNDPYLPYNPNIRQNIPCMQPSIPEVTAPPITLEEGLSRRDFYTDYQPKRLRQLYDVVFCFLFLLFVLFTSLGIFIKPVCFINAIIYAIVLVGLGFSRRKEFVLALMLEQGIVFFSGIIPRGIASEPLILLLGVFLYIEMKDFDNCYNEYINTCQITNPGPNFTDPEPVKTNTFLTMIISFLSVLIFYVVYIISKSDLINILNK